MSGFNKISEAVRAESAKWELISLTSIPKTVAAKKKSIETGENYTFPQFFLTDQGVHLNKRDTKYMYAFSRL